jgi:hypothetical protein
MPGASGPRGSLRPNRSAASCALTQTRPSPGALVPGRFGRLGGSGGLSVSSPHQ